MSLKQMQILDGAVAVKPEQEPVAWADRVAWNKKVRDNLDSLLAQAGFQPDSSIRNSLGFLNFDAPPQRKPLTDEEMKKIWYAMQNIMGWYSFQEIARAIEAAHGIKENT